MYSIQIEQKADEFIRKLDRKEAEMLLNKIYQIRENPFRYLKKLQGDKLWRLRIANYRVIVDVVISMNKIIVLKIGHRKNVYD